MEHWYMLSLVGKDRPGLVAQVSAALCKAGCNLGDSSMSRLGGNFSIMVMVQWDGLPENLQAIVQPICQDLSLTPHIDSLSGGMEHHVEPDVRISVYAVDRLGIVEDVTTALADAGLNILHLDSNIDLEEGSQGATYYLHIEGTVSKGLDPLYAALDILTSEKKMNAQLIPINPQVQ
ncbi:MAG: ACT domain-containing protein [Nitrospinota bacterium]|nr:ACT domain-containing protein [Nitrospinota bacterium]